MTNSEIRRLKAMYRRKNASDALVKKGIDPAEERAAENEKAELEDVKAALFYVAMMCDVDLDDGDDTEIMDEIEENNEIATDLEEDLSGEEEEGNE